MTATRTSDAAAPAAVMPPVMTIGQLARRTGLSVKALRRLEGMGLIYTIGRSPAGYRLFDQSALWCVGVLGTLRGLGLTLAERLRAVRARLDERIGELQALRAASTPSRQPTRPSSTARVAAATSCSPTTPGAGAAPPVLDPPPGGNPSLRARGWNPKERKGASTMTTTGSSTCGPAGGAAATSIVNLNQLTPYQLTQHLAAWFAQTVTEEQRRLLGHVLRELAGGQPVEPARLATLARLAVERVQALLRQAPSEWDPSGQRLVGLGLTMVPTQHRYQTHGHDLWAWCAGDTLAFRVWIGAPAQVESPCAATGELVRVEVTPTGVRRVEPEGAVMSFVTPAIDLSQVRQAVCAHSQFFRSAEAAAPWHARHPDGLVLPVAEAFQALRPAILQVWGDLLPG
jgi:alkylmercury lyase